MSRKKASSTNQKQLSRRWLYINIAVAGLLIIVAGIGLVWASQQPSSTTSIPQPTVQPSGQAAPNFTLTTLDGETVNLSDFRGKVVLVNFWASWCPPCVAELPTIHQFYQSHQTDGFVVLAVNAQEDRGTVSGFINQHGYTFPVLLDPDSVAADEYGIRALPTSFIVDKNGEIRYVHRGEIDTATLKKVVEPLL